MKLTLPTALCFLFVGILISCTTRKAPDSLMADKIDSLLQTVPDFSGVVLVADHGHVIYHKAKGLRNFEEGATLDTLDIFELASISKQFTSMIIMMLEEEQKLSFDDSISRYIPELPYAGITIRHLLTHTSGLPDYQEIMDAHWDKSKVASNTENIEYLTRFHPPVLFLPGEKYEYSNTGYMLLATIAEKASGADFLTLCRQRIFIPLSMLNTDFRTPDEKKKIAKMAKGYLWVAEKHRYISADSFPEFNYTIWLGNRKGPGRISSTARDLLKWDRALYTDQLVSQQSMRLALSPTALLDGNTSNYGFGWVIGQDAKLGKVVSHTGDNPGYKTEIIRYIEADKTIILLNNNAHREKATIIDGLKEIIRSGA